MSAETPQERPILFNDQMVRAILEGRKTVTRRAVKGLQIPTEDKTTPHEGLRWSALGQRHLRYGFNVFGSTKEECAHELARCGVCPFGKPGDRLWVRETFADIGCRLTFRADLEDGAHCSVTRWTPSLHMPRWASRILLEITAVRVERLQDITPNQCIAEGAWREKDKELGRGQEAIAAFADLWRSTGGDWDANPWVWVIEFKRVTP
ncbi:morphogenetic protein [Pseudomonas aeruginosa]